MEESLKELLNLLSEKDGINYLDPYLSPFNIPLSIIPLLKCENKKGAVEHLLHDMIGEYHPQYNHDQYDKIFATAIDYLDSLERKNRFLNRIETIRDGCTVNQYNNNNKLTK